MTIQSHAAYLLQTAPLPAPSVGQLGAEYGLLGVVVVLCFQKGWELFSKKEAAESDLVGKLIEGLRDNQSQLLTQMARSADRSHEDIRELKNAILQLSTVTKSELQESRQDMHLHLERQQQLIAELRVAINDLQRDK